LKVLTLFSLLALAEVMSDSFVDAGAENEGVSARDIATNDSIVEAGVENEGVSARDVANDSFADAGVEN
jgi:hypothetical protein